MKRFNHDNIVQLLGVTTAGKPAYAIMDFMLYGKFDPEKRIVLYFVSCLLILMCNEH